MGRSARPRGWSSGPLLTSRPGRSIPIPTPPASDNAHASAALVAQLGQALLAAAQQQTATSPSAPHTDGCGVQLASRTDTRTAAEKVRLRASVERSMRIETGRRARRMPYAATGATAVAGYGAWGAAELAQAAAGPLGQIGTVAGVVGLCAAGLGGARVVYRHGFDRLAPRWRRRCWIAGAGAASWITTASVAGPDSWAMSAALAAGAAAVSAGWMREHDVPDPDQADPRPIWETEPEPTDDLGEILAQRWAEHVGSKAGVVPGAMLTGRTDLPTAIQWMVQTPPGKLAFDQLLANRPRIAAGLRQAQTKVILEPVAEDESAAWLSVVTRDVLAAGVPYPGPRYLSEHPKDGRIPIGPFADGTGEADYVAVDSVGCRNGVATGAPGAGKSVFLAAVALGLKASGRWHVLFGDGDPGGGSSPLLNRLADWAAAGPEEALAQLDALEELLEVRTALKSTLTAGPDGTPVPITDPRAQLPLAEMLPCREYPGVQWILDELHRLTQDPWLKEQGFTERLEALARLGRKYGIAILAGTQSLLVDDFGGSTKLRGFLADRNCFVYRTTNRTEQHVVAGLKVAPTALPPGGGYAFAVGASRVAMLRGAWSPDMSPHLAGMSRTPLDPDGERVMDCHRPRDAGNPAILYAEAAAKLRQLRTWTARSADQTKAPRPPAADHLDHSNRARIGVDHARTTVADRPDHARTSTDQRLTMLRIPAPLSATAVIGRHLVRSPSDHASGPIGPGVRTTPAESALTERIDTLSNTYRTIYDALISLGDRQTPRTAQLVDLTGLPAPTVSKGLAALAERGLAHKRAHGAWVGIHPTKMRSENSGHSGHDTGTPGGNPSGSDIGDAAG